MRSPYKRIWAACLCEQPRFSSSRASEGLAFSHASPSASSSSKLRLKNLRTRSDRSSSLLSAGVLSGSLFGIGPKNPHIIGIYRPQLENGSSLFVWVGVNEPPWFPQPENGSLPSLLWNGSF